MRTHRLVYRLFSGVSTIISPQDPRFLSKFSIQIQFGAPKTTPIIFRISSVFPALLWYIYYWIKSPLTQQKFINIAIGSAQKALTIDSLKKLDIYLPPLEEQEHIVNILDKFDRLINDISEGIPAEIELRRQQYEYYRNKLLSFEELNVSE